MKKCLSILLCLILIFAMTTGACAEEEIEDLYNKLPDEVKEEIDKDEITSEGLLDFLKLENIWRLIKDKLFTNSRRALTDLVTLASVIIVIMFTRTVKSGIKTAATSQTLNLITTLVLGVTVYSSVSTVTAKLFSAIYDIAVFQNSLMAVMGAALVTSGNPTSAAILPSAIVVIINILTQINSNIFLPLINVYFTLVITEGIFPEGVFSGICASIKKFLVWGITAGGTLLVGIISLQKSVAKAGDSTLTGAVKLTISSAIPVVGGVMKDAYSAVAGSMSAIKASAGVLGITAVIIMLLPVVISALIYMLTYRAASSFAGMSGDKSASGILKNISSIWDIIFAIIVSEGAFTVIAISILINIGTGSV